jgi:predicted CXXCH cytochrome family protein
VDGAERLLLVAIAVLGAGAVVRLARGAGAARWLFGGLVVYAAGLVALAGPGAAAEAAPAALPARTTEGGYIGSDACRSCHPAEHASWHRSFHRTMTQVASARSVLAPLSSVRLEDAGHAFELELRGDTVWARLPDPDIWQALARDAGSDYARQAGAGVPTVERRVVLTTGSHHYQAYWVDGGKGAELRLFPFVYLLETRTWVARRHAFLQPPDAPQHAPRWNASCIQCHSVAGRPGHDAERDVFTSRVAELGIACEACHGPGDDHARKHQNPLTRYAYRLSDDIDDSIVNPARLDAERASEVCGQCHSYFVPRDEARWWNSGFASDFRPGQRLHTSRVVLNHAEQNQQAALIDASFESLFWADGTIRIGGREHNGLLRSPCFERGQGKRRLSCLSCHSMHDSDPDDQLATGMQGNEACLGCHADMRNRVAEHTHHAPGSSGSSCYGCHMPLTSYALLKGVRSHRIDSPSADRARSTGRPDACSLCHLDRTLEWSADKLADWYGHAPLDRAGEPTESGSQAAAALGWLLAGDAAQRVVVAYAMGRPEAQQASGADWQAPFLAELLDDPYAAVRFVAARSLRSLPGFTNFNYDFTLPAEVRRAALQRARQIWELRRPARTTRALLLDHQGRIDDDELAAWLARRDDRPVTISE